MQHLLLSLFISSCLIIITTVLYYEVLRYTWQLLPRMTVPPRKRIVVVVLAIFGGHTAAVWIYAISYWLLTLLGFGHLSGVLENSFVDYLYFSASTYSSLGFGDVYPSKGFRIISSIEVLNGLVLIGWSASFTYLVMQRFWGLHRN